MSELPDRPDLDQLRRQARELLRAATAGEPRAVARIRAVSERATLSVAQLALAREYGFPSWPVLKAEVQRRRRLAETGARPPLRGRDGRGSPDAPEERWSFGGATAIEIAQGVLSPGALLIGLGHAALDADLAPSGGALRALALPRRARVPGARFVTALLARRPARYRAPRFDDVAVTDDRGTRYTLSVRMMGGAFRRSGEAMGPMSLGFELDPVPGREVGWLELRSQDGSATRLLPSARPAVRVSQVARAAGNRAERALSEQALSLIELKLAAPGEAAQDILSEHCSEALARAAEIQRSGELDAASELPDRLARLCASLTGQHPDGSLPSGWSGMLGAARRTDGPRLHLDIAAVLPPVDGIAAQLDSLFSLPGRWQVYLRARPGWWTYSEDHRRRWTPVSVHAEDDLGGMYVSASGGSTHHGDYEELALRFLPRLDPLARSLKLTFRGASEEVAVDLDLKPATAPEPG
ncbi:MAG: hypothetical protein ACM3ML_21435 [Micromonosporaceae bacterium]